jgi:hypothetical protein
MAMFVLIAGLWKIHFSLNSYDCSSEALKPTIDKDLACVEITFNS